jgi:hypothetical protein
MIYQIVYRQVVYKDIKNAVDYYKSISPKLANQFLLRVREAKALVRQYPQGFEIKYKSVRTILLKQFPYHIHYLIDAVQGKIIILGIIHAYKNPMDYTIR